MDDSKARVDIKSIPCDASFFDEFDKATKQQWKELAIAGLKGAPFDKVLLTKTYEGITLEPIYDQQDLKDLAHLGALPGYKPFVRGTTASGFVCNPWRICQELTIADPADFNTEALYDLARGQDGLTMVLDQASVTGHDASDADTQAVGCGGVSISCADDLKTALNKVNLNDVQVQCFAGASPLPLVAMLAHITASDKMDLSTIGGCIGADPLALVVREGTIPMSMDDAWDSLAATMRWAVKNAPKLQIGFIQGHVYHNAGASSTQEVGFALASSAEMIRQMLTRGLTIDEVAPRIRWGLSLGSNFFMEIAKLRAARILWTKLVAAFGGNDDAQKLTIFARSSAANKTVYDAHVNMLRITSEGFSGAVGGADMMHLSPFDEPIGVPDRFSRRIARNVQIILCEEAHFTQPIDMAAGSYYVETLTDRFAKTAWDIFRSIEEKGGMFEAIQSEVVQNLLEETASQRRKNVETRKDVILGTNMYVNLLEKPIEPVLVDHASFKQKRTKELRAYLSANAKAAKPVLASGFLKQSDPAKAAIEAVGNGATLQRIYEAMCTGPKPTVRAAVLQRFSEGYEQLRARCEAYKAKHGKAIDIFLANMGPIAQHKPRADFTAGFFEIAGFNMLKNDGFDTAESAAEAAIASDAPIVVICSTDAAYPEYVPVIASTIKAKKPEVTLIVAGKQPDDITKTFVDAGVDDFIHVRSNCYEFNQRLQDKYIGGK